MKFFEEFVVGERRAIGSHTFTAEEIKRFASAFDPQAFHVDEEAAAKSHFGRLCASGWHTLAVWMRLNVRAMQLEVRELQMAGRPLARLGPSPGFDDLKWLRPVYAGDTISYESEVVATKPSRSRPEWGLVSVHTVGRNQAGEEAVAFTAHVLVERSDKAAPAGG
ncbi:MAG: MaoC family dehydratase [Propylenella sp.]